MSKTSSTKPILEKGKIQRQEIKKAFIRSAHQYKIPEHTIPGLLDFFMDGVPTGTFLQSVLTNDLKMACAKADIINQPVIWNIVNFCYNVLPYGSWGSTEAYESWIKIHAKRDQ